MSYNANIPPDAYCFFREGNAWACVRRDFINLVESPAGFGPTMQDAMLDLEGTEAAEAENADPEAEVGDSAELIAGGIAPPKPMNMDTLDTPWDVSVFEGEWVQLGPSSGNRVEIIGTPEETPPDDAIGRFRSRVICTAHGAPDEAERIALFIVKLMNGAVASGARP